MPRNLDGKNRWIALRSQGTECVLAFGTRTTVLCHACFFPLLVDLVGQILITG